MKTLSNGKKIIGSLSELTIEDFYKISDISTSQKKDELEKIIDIIDVLSKESTLDDIGQMELEELMSLTEFMGDIKISVLKDSITIDGKTFELVGKYSHIPVNGLADYKFSVKQIMDIHKFMKNDSAKFAHKMMSMLYVNKDIQPTISEKIFVKNMTMDYVMPFINILNDKYGNKF